MRKNIIKITVVLSCLLIAVSFASCSRHKDTATVSNTLKGLVKSMDAIGYHSMVVMEDGTLWAWGDNQYGQLGDGTTETRFSPVKIMKDVLMVSTSDFTMAVKNDGTLWGWGENSFGQLGNGTTEDRYSPVKIMDDVKYVSVDGYASHTAAVKTDGSLWVWGSSRPEGIVADGKTFNQYYPETPTKVMENVVQASSGGAVVMAILEDGTLWGFGHGKLGNGDYKGSIAPVLIMEDVAYVKANTEFTAAIKTDGSLWTWGENQNGMLGNGTRTGIYYSPVKIMEDVVYTNGTTAITADGTLWAWHLYETQHDDDGHYTLKSLSYSPVAVLDNVAQVASTPAHAFMLMTDGTLWAWGANDYGQLGNPSVRYIESPIEVYNPITG